MKLAEKILLSLKEEKEPKEGCLAEQVLDEYSDYFKTAEFTDEEIQESIDEGIKEITKEEIEEAKQNPLKLLKNKLKKQLKAKKDIEIMLANDWMQARSNKNRKGMLSITKQKKANMAQADKIKKQIEAINKKLGM